MYKNKILMNVLVDAAEQLIVYDDGLRNLCRSRSSIRMV
jgi:hypothetical protein